MGKKKEGGKSVAIDFVWSAPFALCNTKVV